jgi:hypothetical protein
VGSISVGDWLQKLDFAGSKIKLDFKPAIQSKMWIVSDESIDLTYF